MGMLLNGVWSENDQVKTKSGGQFVRATTSFRNTITANGSSGFKAEPNRYHLYVSYACPWASRTIIFRKLKKLEDIISMSVVSPINIHNGWTFEKYPDSTDDPINHAEYLYQIYSKADPNYTGRVSVPVLWDKQQNTIVNNESAEIIRMLNSEFNAFTDVDDDYYPTELREEIDAINDEVYKGINNGVYKVGFATKQSTYEAAYDALFDSLDNIEQRLSHQEFLVNDYITEADWRLFVTLIRFDAVYYGHFKCNKHHIWDYPNLFAHMKKLYHWPGIKETVNFDHIKTHYYVSGIKINPNQIVPKGPEIEKILEG